MRWREEDLEAAQVLAVFAGLGAAREPTVVLPFPGNLAQFGDAVELGVEV